MTAMTVSGIRLVNWMSLAAPRGSNPVGSKVSMHRMSGMRAPAIIQAMPSRCLLMLTVISFPPGLRRMRLRQFCLRGSRLGFGAGGMELEGHWGGILGFFLRVNGASSLPVEARKVPLRFAGGIGGVVGISWSGIVSD